MSHCTRSRVRRWWLWLPRRTPVLAFVALFVLVLGPAQPGVIGVVTHVPAV